MGTGRHRAAVTPAGEPDRSPIEEILIRTGIFKESEIKVALEVIDVYLHRADQEDYQVYKATWRGRIAGFVCFGPNTMTEATFELYWIAIDPALQGKGLGTLLLQKAEREASRQGGGMMVVETSSRDDYRKTRNFYQRMDYREEARVGGFYSPGDDKIIFVKAL